MSKDLISKGKKALNLGVVSATMLWSAGFTAILPTFADTATLNDGDLVKSTATPDVYWYSGGKRSPFPNQAVFNSWNLSFKNVVKMAQADLNKISLSGSNVTYRPCTRMIKIQTDPKVYVVSPNGTLHWVTSEAVASSMFGTDWNKKIDDVADVFFTNYTIGSDITAASPVPGCFLKEAASGDTFYVNADGSKSKVDASGLSANRVNLAYVWTATKAVIDAAATSTTKPTISAADSSLLVYAPKGSTTTPTTPETPATPGGTGLSAALASDSPATTSILVGTGTVGAQALVNMLKVNLTAGADGDVAVSTLKFKRLGVASDSDINNAYLYDGSGKRLAEMQSISSGVLTFSGSPLLTVIKGTTLGVMLKIDLATSATSGKTLGFALNAKEDVGVATGVTVSGTYPQTGNLMSVASVADLGRLTVANISPNGAITADAQDNYEAWRFSLQATNQDVKVSYLAMTNTGTTSGTDLANFKLYDGGTQLGSTVAAMDSSKMVIFDLSASPLKITAGQTKQLVLKLDIKSGAGRTFQFSFQKASDVRSKDANYNVDLFPFPTGGTAGVWTVVRSHTATTATTINSGSLSVSKTSDSPSGNVALNGTNVNLGKFEFKAAGEDMKVNNLILRATVRASGAPAVNTGRTIRNVKIFADGTQVGTTQTTLTDRATNSTFTQANATNVGDTANDVTVTLGNSLVITAGKAKMITIVGDLTGTAVANDVVIVGFAPGSGNGQGSLSLTTSNVPAAASASNAVTIASGSLGGSLNSSVGNMTVVKGATTQLVGSAILTAGSAEGIDLTSVTLTDSTGTAVEALGTALSNVKLYNGTTQLGTTFVNPGTSAGSTLTFSISPALTIPANGSVQIDVKADILSGSTISGNDGVVQVSAASGTGKSTSTTVSLTAAANLQTFTVADGGTITISVDSSTPQDQQIVMASTGNTLGVWKVQANNAEDLTLSQLVLVDNSADANSVKNIRNLKLYADGAQVGNTVPGLSLISTGTTTAAGTATALTLAANETDRSGYYVVITSGADAGKVGYISAHNTTTDVATVTNVGAALTNGGNNGVTYKVVTGAVFSGINKTISSNNFKLVTLKGDGSDLNNASVGLRNRFVLGTLGSISGAGSDTVVAVGSSSGAFATLANINTAYSANNASIYRTKLTATANSATPSGTGKTRTANDVILKADLKADSAFEAKLRAAYTASGFAAGDLVGALDGSKSAVTVTAADAALATACTVTGDAAGGPGGFAANSLICTDAAAPGAKGMTLTFGTNQDLTQVSAISLFLKSTGAAETVTVSINDSVAGVTDLSTSVALLDGQWQQVVLPLSSVATASKDAVTFVRFSATTINTQTIAVAGLQLVYDYLKVNLSASTNLDDGKLVTLRNDNNSATVASGYSSLVTGTTAGHVYFIPTQANGDFIVSAGSTLPVSLVADTTSLLAGAASLSSYVNLGSSASGTVTTGDLWWYDGSTIAAATTGSVTWVNNTPNPLQGGSLSYN